MFLFVGDLHFHSRGPLDDTGYPEGLGQCLKTMRWVGDIVRAYRPRGVVQLGDIHHLTDNVDASTVSAVSNGFEGLAGACRDAGAWLGVLSGNHDQAKRDGSRSLIESLRGRPGVHLAVDAPLELDGVVLVPHFRDLEHVYAAAERLAPQAQTHAPKPILCLHQELRGGVYSNGQPIGEEHSVSLEQLPAAFGWVISGDVHHPQRVGSRGIHPGAPLCHSFVDTHLPHWPRGVLLLDPTTGKLQQFENPHGYRYRVLDVTTEADLDRALDGLEPARACLRVYCSPLLQEAVQERLAGVARLSVLPPRKGHAVDPLAVAGVLEISPEQEVRDRVRYHPDPERGPALLAAGLDLAAGLAGPRPDGHPVHLDRVELENFISLGRVEHTWNHGLLLVEGDNGVGKSAAFTEGLYWILTGELLRGGTAGDVVREDAKKARGKAWLTSRGRSIVVERTRTAGGKLGLSLEIDGADVSGDTPTQTQKDLVKELGFRDDVKWNRILAAGVFLAQTGQTRGRESLARALPEDRKTLIEEVVDFGDFDTLRTRATAAEKAADKAHTEAGARVKSLDEFHQQLEAAVQRAQAALDAVQAAAPQTTAAALDQQAAEHERRAGLQDGEAAKLEALLDSQTPALAQGQQALQSWKDAEVTRREALATAAEAERVERERDSQLATQAAAATQAAVAAEERVQTIAQQLDPTALAQLENLAGTRRTEAGTRRREAATHREQAAQAAQAAQTARESAQELRRADAQAEAERPQKREHEASWRTALETRRDGLRQVGNQVTNLTQRADKLAGVGGAAACDRCERALRPGELDAHVAELRAEAAALDAGDGARHRAAVQEAEAALATFATWTKARDAAHADAAKRADALDGQATTSDTRRAQLERAAGQAEKAAEQAEQAAQEAEKQLADLRAARGKLEGESATLATTASAKRAEADQLTARRPAAPALAELRARTQAARTSHTEATSKIGEVETWLKTQQEQREQDSQSARRKREEARRAREQATALRGQMAASREAETAHRAKVEAATATRDTAAQHRDAHRAQVEQARETLRAAAAHLDVAQFWAEQMPEVRNGALARVVGWLNERLAFYVPRLNPEATAEMVFEGGKLFARLLGRDSQMISGGQSGVVDLAGALAFRDLTASVHGFSMDALTGDEVLGQLDPAASAAAVELLQDLAATNAVVVVSHNPETKGLFSNVVEVVAGEHGSTLRRLTGE